MKHLAIAFYVLILACGGSAADETPDQPTDIEQASGDGQARGWCCEAERFGVPVLACGYDVKPFATSVCYCAGVVGTSGATCEQTQPYTPGTLCTGSSEVCL